MGNKSSKIMNDDDAINDSNEELFTKSNEVVSDKNPENKTGFIGSKVPEFEKDVYLPKTDVVGILKREDLEGVFSVLYFFSGDFDPGVLPEISELKKMTSSPDSGSAGISNYNLLAVSTDSIDAHKVFSQMEQSQGGLKGIDVVLVSDQTGELCKMFQIYNESCHSAYPSYVILDPEVKVISKTTFDPNVGGDITSIFKALKCLLNESRKDDAKDHYKHIDMASKEKDNTKKDINENTGDDIKVEACNEEACNKNERSVRT